MLTSHPPPLNFFSFSLLCFFSSSLFYLSFIFLPSFFAVRYLLLRLMLACLVMPLFAAGMTIVSVIMIFPTLWYFYSQFGASGNIGIVASTSQNHCGRGTSTTDPSQCGRGSEHPISILSLSLVTMTHQYDSSRIEKGQSTPLVSSQVGNKLPLPIYADVRHSDDAHA